MRRRAWHGGASSVKAIFLPSQVDSVILFQMNLRSPIICIFFVSASALIGEPTQKSSLDAQERAHKTAKDFKSCPAGHAKLKDIPILYGRFGVHYKKPADYTPEDKALSERQKRGEVVLGGDLIPPNPAQFQVTCSECGYFYSPDMGEEVNQPVGAGDWTRHSPKSKSFKQPLNKLLLSFPIVKPTANSVSYKQTITADKQIVTSEDLSYTTTLSPLEAKKEISDWLVASKRATVEFKRAENAYAYHTYECEAAGLHVHIIDDQFWNPGHVNIWIYVWPERLRE
jgi:hypothetical protein